MSIQLRNELEKLIARVNELESREQVTLPQYLPDILERIEKLEALAHTHNFGRPKGKQ